MMATQLPTLFRLSSLQEQIKHLLTTKYFSSSIPDFICQWAFLHQTYAHVSLM